MALQMGNIMESVERDLKYTEDILEGNETPWNYGKIYSSANDSMDYIMPLIDLDKKDILTVLGSGDQAFNFYENGSTNIELYDINKLTLYYYYLRVWIIKYNNSFYPEYSKVNNLNEYLEQLLSIVKPSETGEEKAYIYWNSLVKRTKKSIENNLFYRDYCYPGNEIYDLSNLKTVLSNKPVFYNYDLTKKINNKKQYDIVFISNIIEWVFDYRWHVETLVDNLSNLVNKDGKIICTKFSLSGASELEKKYFKKKFDYYPLADYYSDEIGKWTPGYVYQKK